MKVLIAGAAGATGKLLVDRALAQGHQVTALLRDPTKLPARHERLSVVRADVLDAPSVERAVQGQDAVVFAVGAGLSKSTVRTEGGKNVVRAMERAGVKRLVAMSTLGAGESRKQMGFVADKLIVPLLLGRLVEDQNGMEAAIRASALDWVLVRPGELKDRPGRGSWKTSLDGAGVSRAVAREDVADFILEQLTSAQFLHQAPAIGY